MVAHEKPRFVTPQEYLAGERRAETRSEYEDGRIVAMAGASRAHALIVGNLARALGNQLNDKPCETYPTDLRVRVPECNRYYYPDVVVACDDPQFEDAEMDTLLTPTLLIEVLSDSTEKKDRGEKLDCYRTLESLNAYILVSQSEPRIERFIQQPDNSWRHDVVKGIEAVLSLETLGCELRLTDIYARVAFPPVRTA